VDAGPLTAQIADYYDRRQHANTTQRGKLAAQLEREAVAEKAPKDVQATLVAPSAEQRLQGLIKALLEYMPQIGEVQDENGDYVDACLRKIISENAWHFWADGLYCYPVHSNVWLELGVTSKAQMAPYVRRDNHSFSSRSLKLEG